MFATRKNGTSVYSAASIRLPLNAPKPSSAVLIAACCAGEASGIGAREKVFGSPCSDWAQRVQAGKLSETIAFQSASSFWCS